MAVSLTLVQRVFVCRFVFFKNRFSSSFLSISLSHTQAQKENHISPAYLGECVRSWTVRLFPHVETCVSVYNFNEMIKRDYHSGHEKKRNKTKQNTKSEF